MMTISLKNRLALTCALFICLALGGLSLVINRFTGLIFTALVKENIAAQSGEIVRTIAGQYDPFSRSFDRASIEAMGMYFVHSGYIVSVEDAGGEAVWDARSCDMRECMEVIDGITARMEGRFNLGGALRRETYPLHYGERITGAVTIETYGPFFYSETETRFLNSVNRLLLTAAVVLIFLSILISAALSRSIAGPVLKAAEAARRIARTHAGGRAAANVPPAGLKDRYRTRELALLSRSINELDRELEEAERRQRRLTGDIAHELRTPITCLQGTVEAMIDGVFPPDREHLASCHEEILRLARLVQDLNTLTSLEWETAALNKTEFDLAKLLRAAADQFQAAAREKGLAFNLSLTESPVTADYDRLKQVFVNLFSNAVNYTDEGGITVTLAQAAAAWEVTVADTGIGIGGEDLPHVFERLYRSDKSRNRGSGGSGLGLAIAAAIIRAHGGTISAESGGPGTGTVFRVRL